MCLVNKASNYCMLVSMANWCCPQKLKKKQPLVMRSLLVLYIHQGQDASFLSNYTLLTVMSTWTVVINAGKTRGKVDSFSARLVFDGGWLAVWVCGASLEVVRFPLYACRCAFQMHSGQ